MNKKTCNALIIEATAGSGKTTTIVDGLSVVTGKLRDKLRYTPSAEQSAIWEWMGQHINNESDVLFLAFNNAIVDELKERIVHGVASTIHSMGYKILRNSGVKCNKPNSWKTVNLYCQYMNIDNIKNLDKDGYDILDDVKEIVKMCKDQCITEDDIDDNTLKMLCMDRQYVLLSSFDSVTPAVKYIITEGSRLKTGIMSKPIDIDFDDMIYLPARYGFKTEFDVMLVDEAQDLSHGKLQLILNQDCNNYIFVGDPNQAIYGFAGADTQSFAAISEAIEEVSVLPLSYTYRCGKAIVEEARKIVGNAINYGPTNPEGVVNDINQEDMILTEGDMLVSRVNAPLMGIAWGLVKQRKNVKVMGRDIGKGLTRLIKKLSTTGRDKSKVCIEDPIQLTVKVEEWRSKQIQLLQNKKADTDMQQVLINDQADCICQIAEECKSVSEMVSFIDGLFDDSDLTKCIRLSSIHRSKGLEASRVFFFNPAIVPHPMAKTEEAIIQEHNLKFVATTRAINELVYVTPTVARKGSNVS